MKASEILLSLQHEHLDCWKVPDGIAVSYTNAEVKDGYFLIGTFGVGNTFEDACEDYISKVRGKTLVFGACTKNRKEVRVLG